jgi:hypothetical protein
MVTGVGHDEQAGDLEAREEAHVTVIIHGKVFQDKKYMEWS